VRAWQRQANPRPKGGRQRDLAAACRFADRFGAVFDQVQEHLNKLIAIGENRRQRGIIVLNELDMSREARLRQTLHVIEHYMNIDRLAFDRPLVAKHLHAIDKLDDTIRFLADQFGQ
jgi:hypothetical protein